MLLLLSLFLLGWFFAFGSGVVGFRQVEDDGDDDGGGENELLVDSVSEFGGSLIFVYW